jgi:hypothetical protein
MKDAAKRWLRYEVADGVRVGMVRFADENLVIGMRDLTAMTAETRAVLPSSRLFGRISQTWSGRTNSAAEFWPILNKKGPNFT